MNSFRRSQISLAVAITALSVLVGCSGGGGSKTYVANSASSAQLPDDGPTNNPSPNPSPTPSPTDGPLLVTPRIIGNLGDAVGGLGDPIIQLGDGLGGLQVLGADGLTAGTGELVSSVGEAVNSVGDGLRDGLGQLGTDPNALGVTVAGAGDAVSDLGRGVNGLGDGLRTLGNVEHLSQVPGVSPLLGTTGDLLGNTVGGLGQGITMVGDTLSGAAMDGPLSPVTSGLGDNLLVPVVSLVEGTTRNLGDQTGIGEPVHDLLSGLGEAVGGRDIAAGDPLTTALDRVLGSAGDALENSGDLLTNEGEAAGPGLLETAGGLVQRVGQGVVAGTDNDLLRSTGQTAHHVGETVASTGPLLGGPGTIQTQASPALSGVTQTVLTPTLSNVAPLTQQLGGATQLGQPVNNLLTTVGSGLSQVGSGLSGGQTGLLGDALGQTVNTAGQTVQNLGGLLVPANSPTGANTGSAGTQLNPAGARVDALLNRLGLQRKP